MKILLIQSHLGRRQASKLPVFPIGLAYVAKALKDHDVRIFDLNFWDLPEALSMLDQELAEFNPDVAGISIRNIDSVERPDIFYFFKTVPETARRIQTAKPGIVLLVGGPGYSIFARQIMERVPEFDFGIYLEGDETTPELLTNLDHPETVKGIFLRKEGRVVFTGNRPYPDFKNLEQPARSLPVIDIRPYVSPFDQNIGIQTKRGCVLGCAYCSYPFLSGRMLRLRTPETVVDEIESLIALGIRRFAFVDNIFNVPRSHALAICREISRRDLDVRWSAWFEVKRFDEELLLAARKAGCEHFGFSPDGCVEKALTVLNKGFSTADLDRCIRLIRRHRVRAGFTLFIVPEMSLAEVIRTLLFPIRVALVLRLKGGARIGWIRIEPNTAILERALRNGYLPEDTDLFPETEKGLARLFYIHRTRPVTDRLAFWFIHLMEAVAIPMARKLLKPFRGRSSS